MHFSKKNCQRKLGSVFVRKKTFQYRIINLNKIIEEKLSQNGRFFLHTSVCIISKRN